MRGLIAFVLASTVAVALTTAQAKKTFDIYLIDVEGGNATLFVSPNGESLMMDAGNAAASPRDAERMVAAAKAAGLTQLDHLMITHWHGDHFGGASDFVARFPVKDFMDHGPNAKWPGVGADLNGVKYAQETWPTLYAKGTHTVVKVGDKIPFGDVDMRAVASNGEFIKTPLKGGGQANPSCPANYQPVTDANLEDGFSIALYVGYGKWRGVQPGDLLINQEIALMCPKNPIGTIDVLLGLHHGQAVSNSPALIHGLQPRVGIMNSGTRKGGEPATMMSVHTSPGFEDLWQLHSSLLSGQEYSSPGLLVANVADDNPAAMQIAPFVAPPPPPAGAAPAAGGAPGAGRAGGPPPAPAHNGQAYWIKVSVQADGSYTVTNTRNNFSKTYAPRAK